MVKPVPTAPVKDFNFTAFAAVNPTTPPPGQQLDQEFNRTNTSVKEAIEFVRQAIGDDGKIKSAAIDISALDTVQGTQGPQGIQGPEGPAGPQGPQGEVGPQGPQGIQGQQGIAGQSYTPDVVSTSSMRVLYDAEPQGFSFLDAVSGTLYFKLSNTAGDWSIGSPFGRGPQGPEGPQGPQGPQGIQGIQGPTGAQGPQGNVGPAGAAGPAGSMVRYGTTVPDNALGNNGDLYLRSNGDLYDKTGGVWTLRTSLIGPEGPQGATGLTGAQGPQGIQGPQGVAGPTGPVGPPGEVSTAQLNAAVAGLNATIDGLAVADINGLQAALDASTPAGMIDEYAGNVPPTGWLKCNGAVVSRTTYAALFAALVRRRVGATITIASPAVISWPAHGLSVNDPVVFTTTGALPTGIEAGTTYFVASAGFATDSFRVSATAGGAAIDTSGTQSGTHTIENAPWGRGDGSTTFALPDLRGEFVRGWDDGRGIDTNRVFGSAQASQNLAHNHTGTADSAGAHTHPINTFATKALGLGPVTTNGNTSSPATASTNSAGAHTHSLTIADSGGTEARPRNMALLYCIKF